MSTALYHALTMAHLDALAAAIEAGADVNEIVKWDDGPLTLAIQFFQCPAERHAALRMLLAAGADPRLLDDDGLGPLFCAMLARDPVALRMLLAAGADPTLEHPGPGETLYEAAEFDYLLETWMMALPERATAADTESEQAWLGFLTRLAVERGKPAPDCMAVLWHAGARRSPRKTG